MPGHRPKSRQGRTAISGKYPKLVHKSVIPRICPVTCVVGSAEGANGRRCRPRGATWHAVLRGRERRPARATKPPLAATLRRIERHAGALATRAWPGWTRRCPGSAPCRPTSAPGSCWSPRPASARWSSGCARAAPVAGERPGDLRRGLRRRAPRAGPVDHADPDGPADQGHHRRRRGAGAAAWPRPGEEEALLQAILRFSREIAFSAARVYARAAESRGAWDARLQALLVDALLRGDSSDVLASRAAALGWADAPPVAVVVGRSPGGEITAVLHAVYRAARRARLEVIGGVHGDRLVVVLGGATDPLAATAAALAAFGDGPVVVGPAVPVAGPGDRVGPGGAGRVPGGAGLAGRAPPGGRRRPAAGAGAGRRRGGPPDAAARRVRRRSSGPAASCWRRWTRSSPPAGCWRARPGSCSCTRTRSATG